LDSLAKCWACVPRQVEEFADCDSDWKVDEASTLLELLVDRLVELATILRTGCSLVLPIKLNCQKPRSKVAAMEGAVLCEVELKENEVDQTVMGADDAVKATATEETEAAANSGNSGATAAFTDQEIRRR